MIRILNLYGGIGGNRKLWSGNIHVTMVEKDPEIAAIYQDMYPHDTVIVGDAHEYLLQNANKFDIIWCSPPCPTHSDIRRCGVHAGQYEALYPDMKLYQEIIFLQNFFKGAWIVENVVPYYEYLIKPSNTLHRHPFWTNFYIPNKIFDDNRSHNNLNGSSCVYGVNLSKYKSKNKRLMLRNMVNPEVGMYLFELAMKHLDNRFKPKTVETTLLDLMGGSS